MLALLAIVVISARLAGVEDTRAAAILRGEEPKATRRRKILNPAFLVDLTASIRSEMDKINQLLLKSLENERNAYEKTKDYFVKRMSDYIEKKFDGTLHFQFCVMATSDKYSFSNYIESDKYEPKCIGVPDLRVNVKKWIMEVIKKYPCFRICWTEELSAQKDNTHDSNEMRRERADNWGYENRTMYKIVMDKDYIENLGKAGSLTPGGPVENEEIIVDQFPCGICGESSDERVLTYCGKKTYHASFCVKCYENTNVVCAICNSKPDRTKCKIIRLK